MSSPATAYARVRDALQQQGTTTYSSYQDIALRSAFQPIVSLSHCRTIGYEALIRPSREDGSYVTPPQLFGLARDEADIIYLDRLCRALHVHNFLSAKDNNSWIFLNVNPVASVQGRYHGDFFSDLLTHTGLPPERVVIEILENAVHDDQQLADSIAFYRDRGCLVAVDDFGSGHSNFGRVWQVKPHIVKLDRSTVVAARHNITARRILPELVNILHEAGSIVLIEGVEDEAEATLAMECGADLAQGYYFGRPEMQIAPTHATSNILTTLADNHRIRLKEAREKRAYSTHISAMLGVLGGLQFHGRLDCREVDMLLSLPGTDRCYLLDEMGRQVGASRVSMQCNIPADPRFRPLESAENAVWIRRPYWHRALAKPNEVQLTRPYISLATGRFCVTLSVCFSGPSGILVLCADVHTTDI